MSTTGFHSEWITIGDNRILIECRASFPGDTIKFIASVASECLLHNATENARIARVFYDDKSCNYLIQIVSTEKSDENVDSGLSNVFGGIFNNGNCQASVELVAKGDEDSDHYNHMEHLSVGAEIAVDRWKHSDIEYQAKVSSPS